MKCLYAAAVAALVLSMPVPEAGAACVNAKCSDSAAIEAARGMIQTSCGCTREGQTHGQYELCVKRTLKAPNVTALIRQKSCRTLVMKCESASICGKPNAAVCCVLKKNGKVKASIVGKTAKCRKGNACGAFLGFFSQFDACATDGTCAGPTTTSTMAPTTTTSTSTSSTTSTTVRPLAAFTCGQPPSGTPCTPADLAATTTNATCTTGFVMTDFSTDSAGNPTVYKHCVDNELCNLDWFDQTSGKPTCTDVFHPTLPEVACHWCCVQDACDVGLKPPDPTLANCTASGVCTPG
jgi:hypothetical protein